MLLLVLGMLAWYVVLFWYYKNVADLRQVKEIQFDFAAKLLDSHYPEFLVAAFGGWLAHVMVDRE